MSIWEMWKQVTRLTQVYELATSNVLDSVEALFDHPAEDLKLYNSRRVNKFTISLADYRSFIKNDALIYRLQILYCFSLIESLAFDILEKHFPGVTLGGGIESWGEQLVKRLSIDPNRIFGGREALIDGAIIRNMIAHGASVYDQSSFDRYKTYIRNGPPWKVGDTLNIDRESARKTCVTLKAFGRQIENGIKSRAS